MLYHSHNTLPINTQYVRWNNYNTDTVFIFIFLHSHRDDMRTQHCQCSPLSCSSNEYSIHTHPTSSVTKGAKYIFLMVLIAKEHLFMFIDPLLLAAMRIRCWSLTNELVVPPSSMVFLGGG